MRNLPAGTMPMAALALLFGGPHWAMYSPVARGLLARMDGVTVEAHLAEAEARSEGDGGGQGGYFVAPGGVAVVSMVGPMTKAGPGSMGAGCSTVVVRRALRQAARDEQVRAVVLRIDSPGGSVSGTHDLAAEVLRTRSSKPVVAYIEDAGCSAAYWVASACERVYAGETALVGSIGTYLVLEDWSRYYQLHGVDVLVFSTGEHKGAGIEGAAITEEQRAGFQRLVEDLNAHFLAAVSRGRSLEGDALAAVSTGEVWVGERARELGLLDGVRSLDDVLDELASSPGAPRPRQARARADEPNSGPQAGSGSLDNPAEAPAAAADDVRRRLADASLRGRLALAATKENP